MKQVNFMVKTKDSAIENERFCNRKRRVFPRKMILGRPGTGRRFWSATEACCNFGPRCENDEFCINNDEFCMIHDEFCI